MSNLRELKKKSKVIAQELDINHDNFLAALELIEKDKIAKPAKVFRESMPKISRRERYDFVYVDMGQKEYFLMNKVFPMGEELDEEIEKYEKKIENEKEDSNPNEDDLELWSTTLFFLEELEELNERGFATGTIKFSKEVENEQTGVMEHLMALKMIDLEVEGTVKKNNLVQKVREDLGYTLVSKLEEVMFLEDEDAEEAPDDQEATNKQKRKRERVNREDEVAQRERNQKIIDKVKRLLARYKSINRDREAYKGLGLIYQIEALAAQLKPVPNKVQELLNNLDQEQINLEAKLSEQIEVVFERSMDELNTGQAVNSSEELEEIFGTLIKMHAGWRKFLNKDANDKHPYGDQIAKIDEEIDIIDKYEDQLIKLREDYNNTEDIEQKNDLGIRINELIEEARIAIS